MLILTSRFLSWAALGLCATAMIACSGTVTSPSDGDGGLGSAQGATDPPASTGTGTGPARPPAPPAPTTPPAKPAPTGTGTTPVTPPPPPGACNAVVNDAASIGAAMIASDAPAPVGGAIVDGKYHLTDVSLFTGVGGSQGPLAVSIQETINIHGSTADVVDDVNGKTTRLTETFTLAGNAASFAATCPSGVMGKNVRYSAVGTTLTLFIVNGAGQTAVYTYSP